MNAACTRDGMMDCMVVILTIIGSVKVNGKTFV